MSDLQVRGQLPGTTGTSVPFTSDNTGAQRVTDAHGRFQFAGLNGGLFSGGMTVTSISNVTFTTATLGATGTPIIGLWNPLGTGKNAVVLQARLQLITTALSTPTGPGCLMWCVGVNQSAISTGITPTSRLSLTASGSVCKVYAGTALTNLSGNLTVVEAAGFSTFPLNATAAETGAGYYPAAPGGIDLIDGAFILQPGSILALLCTTTPVAISAASSILWEEVQVLP